LGRILRHDAQGWTQRSGRFAARVTAVRSVYELFLERCVLIETVQQHRDDADENAVLFFRTGYRPQGDGLLRALNTAGQSWLYANFCLEDPPTAPASVSAGWASMEEACQALVSEMLSGEVRLEGTSPSGLHRTLLPTELAWPFIAIDFFYGELVDYSSGRRRVLWADVTEAVPELPVSTTNLIAMNAARDAEQHAKWVKWQAAADEIGGSHPSYIKATVARLVKARLKPKPKETAQTIAKRIKNTWRTKKSRHDV
jgi:hypothetical protein